MILIVSPESVLCSLKVITWADKIRKEQLTMTGALPQDGRLTKEEIVDKYDLFVGSQATDFGEALTRHDEF